MSSDRFRGFFSSNCQELIDTCGFRPLIRLLSIWITYHRMISMYGTILCRSHRRQPQA